MQIQKIYFSLTYFSNHSMEELKHTIHKIISLL